MPPWQCPSSAKLWGWLDSIQQSRQIGWVWPALSSPWSPQMWGAYIILKFSCGWLDRSFLEAWGQTSSRYRIRCKWKSTASSHPGRVYIMLPPLTAKSGAISIWDWLTWIMTFPRQLPNFRLWFKNLSMSPDTLWAPLARLVLCCVYGTKLVPFIFIMI